MSLPPFLHGCFDWRVNGYHWASEPDIDLLSNAALGADNPFVVVASVVEHAKRGDHTKATHLVQYFEQHEPFALARVALLVFADIALGRDLSYLELALQSPDNHVRTYAGEAAGYCSSLALVPAMVRAWKDAEFVHDYEMIGFAITDLLESEPGEMGNNVGIRDERELNIIPRTEAGRRLLERLMEQRRARDEEPAPLEPSPFPGLVMAEYERLRERYGPDAIVWAGDQLDMTRFVQRFLARAKNPARGVGDFIRLRHRFEAWASAVTTSSTHSPRSDSTWPRRSRTSCAPRRRPTSRAGATSGVIRFPRMHKTMKAKTRKLIVDGVEYRYHVYHEGRASVGCGECFAAFRAGHKTSPLRVHFWEGPGALAGHVIRGTIFVGDAACNLNLPRNAAVLIRLGLARGWTPERERETFEVANGFEWLSALEPGVH